jgi:hypothetical protein
MSEPAGWQWIEAWRNGTINIDDFNSLQRLLREQPEVRRTLRRYMAMDTALRRSRYCRSVAAWLTDKSRDRVPKSRHFSNAIRATTN